MTTVDEDAYRCRSSSQMNGYPETARSGGNSLACYLDAYGHYVYVVRMSLTIVRDDRNVMLMPL